MLSRLKLTTGAVILAAVAYTGCSSNTPTNPTPVTPPPADVTITIVGMNGAQSFNPDPVTIKVGQTVAWRNADTTTHNATSDTAGAFVTGSIGPGGTSTPIKMNAAGSFAYHCSIHPTMVGTLNIQ